MPDINELKNRIVAASLRVAYTERGGLDHVNADAELELAHEILDDALARYVQIMAADLG